MFVAESVFGREEIMKKMFSEILMRNGRKTLQTQFEYISNGRRENMVLMKNIKNHIKDVLVETSNVIYIIHE